MIKSTAILFSLLLVDLAVAGEPDDLSFVIDRSVAHSGFDGKKCWVHARAGAIPAGVPGNDSDSPLVVMTMQKLLLSGSDVFYALNESRSSDLGSSWSTPVEHASFARQTFAADPNELPTGASIAPHLLRRGDETTVCDFTPQWHAASQRLLGLGHTVWYRDNRVMHVRPRGIAYAVYDAPKKRWSQWKTVDLPAEPKFQCAGSGSVQRVDLPGGDVLIPIYFKQPTETIYSVTVCRCRFDGRTVDYVEHGNELTVPIKRGLYEPSLTKFRGRYFLTMRNDEHGYVTVSEDGLHFQPPRRWTFDDGTDLGNYNTQQHWVTHSDALFLVYTRRGANNDHVFRHRAPLFIARVDPETLQVIRDTEQILVPQRGARLGNFGVVDVSPGQTWVTAAEWMQPAGVETHGSDNSVFVAKLKWSRPNQQMISAASENEDVSAAIAGESKASAETDSGVSGGDVHRPAAGQTASLVTPATGHAWEPNPWTTIRPYCLPPKRWQGDFGDYASPLEFDDGTTVETPADWSRRRAEIADRWQGLLGKWPPLIREPEVEILESDSREGFVQHRIRFDWTPHEKTIGYLLIPQGGGPHPAVVTVYYEPETAIGQGKPNRDFALQLARRGFVALSIGTTKASEAGTYALYYPSIDDAKVQPLSMLACAAANAWYVLASRPEVDPERIGIVGHSFGGKWAMFASCLFDQFACAAWSDPGIVFDPARPSVNYWEPWYLGYHPKPWRRRGVITENNPARGLYPRLTAAGHDLHELHALMAPRPFLVSGGAEDRPNRWQALNHSVAVNRILGYDDRVLMTNRPDHSPNEDSNAVIYAFFEHFLKPPRL